MIREIDSFLTRLESEIEEQMRSPLDLQFLNWLEQFLKEVYDAGFDSANALTNQYDKGYHDGYKDAEDEYSDD
jgi:hypothetical protein